MDEENDWDLMAIVRSCNKGKMKMPPSSPNDEAKQFSFPMLPPPPPQTRPILYPMPMDFPYLSATSDCAFGSDGGLEEIVMPFLSRHHDQQQQQPPPPPPPQPKSSIRKPKPKAPSAAARGRKRKNQLQKKVVTKVPPECIHSNDNWAWRKYGQKPIKGSPFPRGYYRCSTAKSCPARKHIEKSWSDPGLFIITYTEEHNHAIPAHRNALAGTSRNKWYPMSGYGVSDEMLFKLGLSPTTPLTISPSTEEEDDDDDEEGILQVEDMQIVGEDELVFLGGDEPTDTGCKVGFDAAFLGGDEPTDTGCKVGFDAAFLGGDEPTNTGCKAGFDAAFFDDDAFL